MGARLDDLSQNLIRLATQADSTSTHLQSRISDLERVAQELAKPSTVSFLQQRHSSSLEGSQAAVTEESNTLDEVATAQAASTSRLAISQPSESALPQVHSSSSDHVVSFSGRSNSSSRCSNAFEVGSSALQVLSSDGARSLSQLVPPAAALHPPRQASLAQQHSQCEPVSGQQSHLVEGVPGQPSQSAVVWDSEKTAAFAAAGKAALDQPGQDLILAYPPFARQESQ